ncbi:class I SAM-dependent methyltransferase [Caballeronia sp. Lep1P3]|uniref:class I SAM-dependent methyltransferase n=1 Tax=Caballeronia sp. Lep1P3 TaxID=2878150 RepID=UPI001FD14852|nr:class I SAM-dependent methyltransferase [Caballeronia sp. Lep1P3]
MVPERMRVAANESICKCCSGRAFLFGVCDFSKSCADRAAGRKVDPYAGVPVYYYRCAECGFVFTTAFDDWGSHAFAKYIYNDDYIRQDPDYLDARPQSNANALASQFPELAGQEILDYGSGNGLLEQKLKARGFVKVDSYDPYGAIQNRRAQPQRSDVVLAFEVFEHHAAPRDLMAELARLLKPQGIVLFSTLVTPPDIETIGIGNWWYCAPRNGHISFFTPKALAHIASTVGMKAASFSDGFHFLYRDEPPDWISRYTVTPCSTRDE